MIRQPSKYTSLEVINIPLSLTPFFDFHPEIGALTVPDGICGPFVSNVEGTSLRDLSYQSDLSPTEYGQALRESYNDGQISMGSRLRCLDSRFMDAKTAYQVIQRIGFTLDSRLKWEKKGAVQITIEDEMENAIDNWNGDMNFGGNRYNLEVYLNDEKEQASLFFGQNGFGMRVFASPQFLGVDAYHFSVDEEKLGNAVSQLLPEEDQFFSMEGIIQTMAKSMIDSQYGHPDNPQKNVPIFEIKQTWVGQQIGGLTLYIDLKTENGQMHRVLTVMTSEEQFPYVNFTMHRPRFWKGSMVLSEDFPLDISDQLLPMTEEPVSFPGVPSNQFFIK